MSQQSSLNLIRLLALVVILIALWFVFKTDTNELSNTNQVTESPKSVSNVINNMSGGNEPKPSVENNDQTILQSGSKDNTDLPPSDLGGIDSIPTPEMLEEMKAYAPEAGDDGIPGPAPEADDDGLPGEPPEAGDIGLIGEPPEGFNPQDDEELLQSRAPSLPFSESLEQ